jgi:O-antigen/teichoic acid export membrane protein
VSVGTSLAAAATALVRAVPVLIIGRWLGAEQLGYYSMARQLLIAPLLYILSPISRVMFALFSRLQASPVELRRTYTRAQSTIVVVAAFIPALVAMTAPLAVPIVLGQKWQPAVPVLQILSLATTLNLPVNVAGAAVRGLGRPRLIVLVTVVPLALPIVGIAVGARDSLVSAAMGSALGTGVAFAWSSTVVARVIQVPVKIQIRPLWIALPPVAGLLLTAQAALWAFAGVPPVPRLVVVALLATAAYAAVLRLTGPAEWRWIAGRATEAVRRFGGVLPRRRSP